MKIYRNIFASIVVLIMLIIYSFSAQPRESSNSLSTYVANIIINILPHSDNVKIDQEQAVSRLNVYIRKYAHFMLFCILGIFVALTFCNNEVSKTILAFSLLFCLFCAIGDEVHQLFVPGRGAQVRDVIIDFSGSCLGVGIVYALKVRARRHISH